MIGVEVYINGKFHGSFLHKEEFGLPFSLRIHGTGSDAAWLSKEVTVKNGIGRVDFDGPGLAIVDGKVWSQAVRVGFKKHMKVSRPRAGRIK